jgi:hypothetical protein
MNPSVNPAGRLSPAEQQHSKTLRKPRRELGFFDSTMIVVGVMIGSGIFIVPADMARTIGSPGWFFVAWVFAGLLTVTAALSYGELASLLPGAGGMYLYLREAFSPLWGFLYGWTLFTVIQTGTINTVDYTTRCPAGYLPSHRHKHVGDQIRQDRAEHLHSRKDRCFGRAHSLGSFPGLEFHGCPWEFLRVLATAGACVRGRSLRLDFRHAHLGVRLPIGSTLRRRLMA